MRRVPFQSKTHVQPIAFYVIARLFVPVHVHQQL
jgi:hypothetical protein